MPLPKIRNPVYPAYFSDPFVYKHNGSYYAFGGGQPEPQTATSIDTGNTHTRAVFQVLESCNLLDWTPREEALVKLDPAYGSNYWAPEIASINGKFWMYYSVGFGDKGHHLRVATSSAVYGPYVDTGTLLTDPFYCPFAIDPSPFRDEDGNWYLFYATDFINNDGNARIGTGIVVDALTNPTSLAGQPTVILRAHHDWQRFRKDRIIYGAVYDWYTLEGPCVRKCNGRYCCLYSAGCWEDNTYGVDYAVADHVLGPYVSGDNSCGPRVLRTVPGVLIGPGHNSIVIGPDGLTEYIVYHAWNREMSKRQMCINALDWATEGPKVVF